ncbi:MAG: sugar phosphate isomerase/epimerase family protein [Nitrosotalea sp.]
MAFKYSVTLSSFRNLESIEQTLVRLKEQGYDAVEMFGEPEQTNLRDLRETFASHDLPVCGITGMWGRASKDWQNRKLLSTDPHIVNHSENYVRKCIEMCQYLGGNEINVCLFADDGRVFDANHGVLSDDQKKSTIEKAIPILSSLVRFASDHDVDLLIEPLNRYSTPHCTAARDAMYIAHRINQDNLGLLLDTFHMNIEESSFEQAIMDSKDFLRHTHFSDNNRAMPGGAHLDFTSIVKTLNRIGYGKYVSFEPNLANADYKSATLDGLKFIRALENSTF